MSETNRIEKLTPSQEASIGLYREKWREIALSTEPIDRQKATEAVKAAYGAIGFKEPEILFCDSAFAAFSVILSQLSSQLPSQLSSQLGSQLRNELRNQLESQLRRQCRILLGSQLRTKLETQLKSQLKSQLRSQLNNKVRYQVASQLSLLNGGEVWLQLWKQLESQLWNQLERKLKYNLRSLTWSIYSNCIQPELWACKASWVDFCMDVLNCEGDKIKGEAFQSLVKSCGWIFPFEKICFVCARPLKISFDSENRLHAEGSPAIQFADGYSLYSYHGVTLPEKYGKLHPSQWLPAWLLEKNDAEVGRVLALGMGIYIEKLTPEQEASIGLYREKWRKIAFSIEPINCSEATVAVKAAYAAIGFKEPEIIFCDSPLAALNAVRSQCKSQCESQLWSQLWSQLSSQLGSQLGSQLWNQLSSQLESQLRSQLKRQLERQLERQLSNYINTQVWGCRGSLFDFCIDVLNCVHDRRKWEVFQLLVKSCGWIFPFEKTCIVCARPLKISFDSENRLHAEGSPAIQFADGYSLYSYHGVTLPEKYGKLHPSQWLPAWLLEKNDAEVRRVLALGMGIYIEKLTPEQEASIPLYREKWRDLAFSTLAINHESATVAVKAAYAAIGFKEPEIIFCDSPLAALNAVRSSSESQCESQLSSQLGSQLSSQLSSQLGSQLWRQLGSQLSSQLSSQLGSQLWRQHKSQGWSQLYNYINTEVWSCHGSLFDFCIDVLNCVHDRREWEVFQLLVKSCGWIFPFEKTCIVCARPIKVSFDSQSRLHAEGEPAIEFADGYSLYSYHGVTLPEKYGEIHPHQWRAQWLLEEDNAEIRRVLIQGIGYGRICQELQATELDCWQEYTLLVIENKVDVEPIHLLKMTCPSTGFIHALRVPPDLELAREAIRWVNWGISPEEFSDQT